MESETGAPATTPKSFQFPPEKRGVSLRFFCEPRQRPGIADSKGKQQGRGCRKHVHNMSTKNGVSGGADMREMCGQPEAPGAGRGQILPAAEEQTVGQPHRNFREIRGGDLIFSKRQPRGRQAGRRLLDVLDVLQPSAGNHAAAGRPRARSATTWGRICRSGALELSKVNAPRRRTPGNAAISPAGTAGGIRKSKHPSASIVIFATHKKAGTAHAGRPVFSYGSPCQSSAAGKPSASG